MATETNPAADAAQTEIASIKGFDHEFKCRGHQFEVGKTYTVKGKVKACSSGFHAVDAATPFHVWDYYPVVDASGRLTRYADVIQSGAIDKEDEACGTKIASGSITVTAEFMLPEFVRRAVTAVIEAARGKDIDQSDDAQIGSSGYYARIGSSGYGARIGSSGNYAQIGSSGYGARIVVEGQKAVVAAAGRGTVVTGAEGAWISLAEYSDDGDCVGFASGCIGRDGLKAGVPYRAEDGKLVEVPA